jgi:RimJ/RimL family protein N-acetyltransferase
MRNVELPGGRRLVIRPIRSDDVDALMALYDGLEDDDRYSRFFSLYRPNRTFCEQVATVAERGGFGLVACVAEPSGTVELVGEAGYTLLDDGDGELGITIARKWRGWLGHVLLATLLECAAERDVPNVQAEILSSNRAMLALARAHGYVTAAHDDWSTVRVLLGTHGPTAQWPRGTESPRILVEVPGGRWRVEEEARAAGLHVLVCPGPATSPARCPALDGKACPLAADADVIVVTKPDDDARWDDLLHAHAALHPGVPVVVNGRDDHGLVGIRQRVAAAYARRAVRNG